MKAESILKETKARWLTKCQCQLTDHPGKKKRLTPARPPKLTKRTGDFPVLYHCFPGLISTWTPKNVLLQWGGEHFHRILDSYPIPCTAWKHQRLGPNFSGLIGLSTNGFLKPIGWVLQVEEEVPKLLIIFGIWIILYLLYKNSLCSNFLWSPIIFYYGSKFYLQRTGIAFAPSLPQFIYGVVGEGNLAWREDKGFVILEVLQRWHLSIMAKSHRFPSYVFGPFK